MSNAITRRPTLNIPIIVLWVVSVGVGLFGYIFLQGGNAAQADFYNTGGDDYLEYLNLQTQSTIGGMLLTAGIVGVFIALATHARNWAAANVAASQAEIDELYARVLDDEEDGDDGFESTGLGARDEETVAAEAPEPVEAEPTAPEADGPKDPTDRA
ncbi:hypothetical protein [Agromyces sp. H66]|uniref:hypothetical protein n=1 Tax=Agromyces sp. H66 TaxID=2529859 RepID=UPI0010A99FBA|nr:hypothetical protein [Agromyces sp. H66]